ncbi:hypothetical protein [Streptomyces sp. NPDC058545]|uniref:hypothetical protein n=1 Tax=Streptomyces sp. NPDC058545 TaxID=3346544 RepID=UPI0036481B3A
MNGTGGLPPVPFGMPDPVTPDRRDRHGRTRRRPCAGQRTDGAYRVLDAVEYGEKLTLPEPFRLDPDTVVFPVS